MSLKERLRGVVAAVATAALAISVAPVTAMAAAWTGVETGSIVINGEGIDPAKVHVYKVADIKLDEHNELSLNAVTGLTDAIDDWKDDESATNAAAIANAAQQQKLPDLTKAEQNTATVTANTDSAGVTISPLAAGVYYVDIDDNASTAYQNIVVAVQPVAQDDGTWVLQNGVVNVKQTSTRLDKTVESITDTSSSSVENGKDKVYEVGDTINYKVTFSVGSAMDEFYLDDTMSKGLAFQDNTLKVYAADGQELTPDTDYELIQESLPDGVTFRVKLTASGIAKCGAETASPYMTYSAQITMDATLAGVNNKVSSSVNEAGTTETTDFAGLKVFKYKTGDESTVLEGAVFGLYVDQDCTQLIKKVTTDDKGYADFGLWLDPEETYYVKEISAPAGYEYSDTVYTIGKNATDSNLKLAASSTTTVEVPNTALTRGDGVDLPQTGGPGTIALTVVGAGLVAGAAYLVMRSRKEN